MHTLQFHHPYTLRQLWRDMALMLGALVLLLGLLYVLWPERFNFSVYIPPVTVLLAQVYNKCTRKRLQELRIDSEANELIFTYATLLSAVQHRKVALPDAHLEITVSKPKHGGQPTAIYIMRQKQELFDITADKDGLTPDELAGIVQMARQQGMPVVQL
jgi:hypothetical protein